MDEATESLGLAFAELLKLHPEVPGGCGCGWRHGRSQRMVRRAREAHRHHVGQWLAPLTVRMVREADRPKS